MPSSCQAAFKALYINFILQIRKLRSRKVKNLTKEHTTAKGRVRI